MFALLAALFFLAALVFAIGGWAVGAVLTVTTLGVAGLFCLALHLSGYGTGWSLKK
ncbi:hypothetical protein [Microtetraspora sp. NBRC 16547]|uniref:hypothetical protein n=1 Tax=Microtetraspora sp. NBRC 16547 TaxID=3030993 RepID=UPI00249FF9F5|nr:hypothetical protein [Microtetraspora sp. NBRC 16547]GLW99661.1 hypothetical protein Misp02_37480 [Microtetraspora sp. NBRC 16547]